MARRAALAAALALLAACNPDEVVHRVGWFATMRHQRNVKPYAMPIAPVAGTVPVTGDEPDSIPEPVASRLANPRARTAESINRGQWVYQTYCQVCHGERGAGDGPVVRLGPYPGVPSLLSDAARRRSDGYVYGIVVNAQAMGRGLMPRYGDKVRGADRWDVVNYLRTLQVRGGGGGGGPQ